MPTNIEIKAKVADLSALRSVLEPIADGPMEVIEQEDVFFATAEGRLKLRIFADGSGELIRYRRGDLAGPKASDYAIAPTSDPAALREILASVLGEAGIVRKRRLLYLVGQTRVHLDHVEGLGPFLELEVVLRPGQPEAEGTAIARSLMDRLGIADSQLVASAYIDLLREGP